MSSIKAKLKEAFTKAKLKEAFTKFKSTTPPLDPSEIDKMEKTDEEKLVLLTNWADDEEKLLRGLQNPRITGTIKRKGCVTSYDCTGKKKLITTDEWNKLIDQALEDEPNNESAQKILLHQLNALLGVSSLLGPRNHYACRFETARDLPFLIRLCKTR